MKPSAIRDGAGAPRATAAAQTACATGPATGAAPASARRSPPRAVPADPNPETGPGTDSEAGPGARSGPPPAPPGPWGRGLKRAFDLGAVILAAPLAVPLTGLMLLCAAAGQPGDRGAPLYGHRRVGRGGREFTCWKIRTMVRDADARLAEHLAADPEAAAEWAKDQKLRDDPRVTRCGRILRATSLDELPQLWNVAMGHMSLVGPRPFTPEQRPLYPNPEAYLALRPGLTGPWQVGARNEDGFAVRAVYDAEYLRRLSFAEDMRILLRTVAVVLRAQGR